MEGYRLGLNSCARKPVDLAKFLNVSRQFGRRWVMVDEAPPAEARGPAGAA